MKFWRATRHRTKGYEELARSIIPVSQIFPDFREAQYLNHQKAFRCWKFQVTEFRVVYKSWGTLSRVVCIMNIDWNQWRREKRENPER